MRCDAILEALFTPERTTEMNSLLLVSLAQVAFVWAFPAILIQEVDLTSLEDVSPIHFKGFEERTVAGFRYTWIDQSGGHFNQSETNTFEVAFTPGVSDDGEQKSLYAIEKIVENMPRSIFERLCQNARAGLFGREDKLTAFPEYAHLADTPECSGTCEDDCAFTCTRNGRKYETLAGVGGVRAVFSEDNLLCTEDDGYNGGMSVLVHELAHTIMNKALTQDVKEQIEEAYDTANTSTTWNPWRLGAYAMNSKGEYFAEATGVFFHTSSFNHANGGMSECFGKSYCEDEAEGRAYLQSMDPQLFALLDYVFTDSTGTLSGITGPCFN